jgi:hypothetical protein
MLAEQPTSTSRPGSIVEELIEPPVWREKEAKPATIEKRNLWARMRAQDWLVALVYMVSDMACWVVIYAAVGYVRRDAFFASPLEFLLVDGVALIVILQALYIIGGYDRTHSRGGERRGDQFVDYLFCGNH